MAVYQHVEQPVFILSAFVLSFVASRGGGLAGGRSNAAAKRTAMNEVRGG